MLIDQMLSKYTRIVQKINESIYRSTTEILCLKKNSAPKTCRKNHYQTHFYAEKMVYYKFYGISYTCKLFLLKSFSDIFSGYRKISPSNTVLYL